mgnify:FL=1
MNRKFKIKIAVDVLMTISLLFLMSFELIGDAAHEWLGMAMFFLFVVHHVLNRKWTGNLRKGKYTMRRGMQTILVVLLLLCMAGSMLSGIILSNYVFKFVRIKGAANLARNVHMLCAYWGFLLMSVHLGMHWNMMIDMAGKAMKKDGKNHKKLIWVPRCIAAAVACYGIYAFWKRRIHEYLFLISHFVFFNFGENLIWFLLDYIAIMGLFVFITYYTCSVIEKK